MNLFKFLLLLTWFFIFATASLNGKFYIFFKETSFHVCPFILSLENELDNQRKCHEIVFGTNKFEEKENIVDQIQLQMREIQSRIDRLENGVTKAGGGK